jgi:hypothetical protein
VTIDRKHITDHIRLVCSTRESASRYAAVVSLTFAFSTDSSKLDDALIARQPTTTLLGQLILRELHVFPNGLLRVLTFCRELQILPAIEFSELPKGSIFLAALSYSTVLIRHKTPRSACAPICAVR